MMKEEKMVTLGVEFFKSNNMASVCILKQVA